MHVMHYRTAYRMVSFDKWGVQGWWRQLVTVVSAQEDMESCMILSIAQYGCKPTTLAISPTEWKRLKHDITDQRWKMVLINKNSFFGFLKT